MEPPTRAIPFTGRHSEPGLEDEAYPAEDDAPPTAIHALPPVSRKKQAAVLLSAFMMIVLTFGYNQSFGIFQAYYLSPEQDLLVPVPAAQAASPPTALLAFVGTLCYGMTWAGGILVNPVIARLEDGTWTASSSSGTASRSRWRRKVLRLLSPRTITVSGVLMMAAGFLLASFARSIWHLLLTQGFLVGLGMSLLYFPLLAPAPEYFTTHRATAMGFVSIHWAVMMADRSTLLCSG